MTMRAQRQEPREIGKTGARTAFGAETADARMPAAPAKAGAHVSAAEPPGSGSKVACGGRSHGRCGQAALRVIALTCFLASTPIYSPNVVALSPETSGAITTWFSRIVLGAALAASLAMLAIPRVRARGVRGAGVARGARGVCGAGGRSGRRSTEGAPQRAPYLVCGLYLVGCVGDVLLLGLSEPPATLSQGLTVACAILAGASLPTLSVAWASLFERTHLARLVIIAGWCLAGGALVNTLFGLGGPVVARTARVILLAIGTLYLARVTCKQADAEVASKQGSPAGATDARRGSPANAEKRAAEQKGPASEQATLRAQLAAFASVMGTPLAGIALSSYVVGIAPTAVFGGALDTQVVGTLVAALAVVPVALARSKVPTSALVHAVFVPIAAALALAVCALPGATSDVRLAASYSLFSIVSVVALATGCGISNAREFSRASVFAALVGTHCLAAMLGLATGILMDEATTRHAGIVVVLCAAYGVLAIAVACRRAACAAQAVDTDEDGVAGVGASASTATSGTRGADRGRAAMSRTASGVLPVPVSVEERAERLAARFELTPRETEIVRILARGHGCTYVAETLLISKSTVYTHVRNMYRKLGVSSHDELIALLDQQA